MAIGLMVTDDIIDVVSENAVQAKIRSLGIAQKPRGGGPASGEWRLAQSPNQIEDLPMIGGAKAGERQETAGETTHAERLRRPP